MRLIMYYSTVCIHLSLAQKSRTVPEVLVSLAALPSTLKRLGAYTVCACHVCLPVKWQLLHLVPGMLVLDAFLVPTYLQPVVVILKTKRTPLIAFKTYHIAGSLYTLTSRCSWPTIH